MLFMFKFKHVLGGDGGVGVNKETIATRYAWTVHLSGDCES